MRSINKLGLDLESVEVRKKVIDFLMGANVEFKYSNLEAPNGEGKIIGYRNEIERTDFILIILAVEEDYPFSWRYLDEVNTIIHGVDSETKKVFTHISFIQISDILADALVASVKGNK